MQFLPGGIKLQLHGRRLMDEAKAAMEDNKNF